MKKQFFFLIIFHFITLINGQSINLNQSSIIENIRDQQLIGNISSDLSFNLKPISLENFDTDEIKTLKLQNYAPSFIKFLNGKINFNGTIVNDYPIYLRTAKFKIGYVPQYGGYFGDLTLLENLKAIAEIVILEKELIKNKIDQLIAKFELDAIRDTKAKYLSGGQKKKLVIALALLSDPKILLLDECFAALDVLTIKMLQEIIVNLQTENNITICICDHQARDLLSCVDVALILSNCKIVAQGSPNDLVNNVEAKNAYFGDTFKFN